MHEYTRIPTFASILRVAGQNFVSLIVACPNLWTFTAPLPLFTPIVGLLKWVGFLFELPFLSFVYVHVCVIDSVHNPLTPSSLCFGNSYGMNVGIGGQSDGSRQVAPLLCNEQPKSTGRPPSGHLSSFLLLFLHNIGLRAHRYSCIILRRLCVTGYVVVRLPAKSFCADNDGGRYSWLLSPSLWRASSWCSGALHECLVAGGAHL